MKGSASSLIPLQRSQGTPEPPAKPDRFSPLPHGPHLEADMCAWQIYRTPTFGLDIDLLNARNGLRLLVVNNTDQVESSSTEKIEGYLNGYPPGHG
jgi:hypothetical protein